MLKFFKPARGNGVHQRGYFSYITESVVHIHNVLLNHPNEEFKVYFDLFENPYWVSEIMKWRITGPITPVYNIDGILTDKGVIESNNASISIISQKVKNVKLYLPNILQFHK